MRVKINGHVYNMKTTCKREELMDQKPTPNWYSKTMISTYVDLSRGMLESAKEQIYNLEQVKSKPHILDDETVARIIKLHTEQNENNWVLIEQCKRWRKEQLDEEELKSVQEIEANAYELEKTNKQILDLANSFKDHTINKVLAKSDINLALAFLTGDTSE